MSYATGDSLLVRVRIAFGASIAADPATWTWTDVTDWWHVPDAVDIGWGRSSGADQAETSTMTITLKNTDGRFTAYDPRSPYWPNVQKWTPISYDIDLNDGSGWRNRFSGFIRRWPLTWPGRSSKMALARIEAVGVLGRLGRGKPPTLSALRRTIAASSPVAYWPLEDGVDSTQAASGLLGGTPMSVGAGVMDFIDEGPPGSAGAAKPDPNALNALNGTVVGGSATQWQASIWARGVEADPLAGAPYFVAIEVRTDNGHIYRMGLQLEASADVFLAYYVDEAATLDSGAIFDPADGIDGKWHLLQATLAQVGADVGASFYHNGALIGSATWVGVTLGRPVRVSSIGDFGGGGVGVVSRNISEINVAHIAVHNTTTLVDQYQAGLGYLGETATDRMARLCAEDGVDIAIPAVDSAFATAMGVQPVAAPLDLYRLCEDADQGVLHEAGFGLAYLPRGNRYSPPVALTVDAGLGQLGMPFEPVDDDQALRNKWTVSRTGGSSAVALDQASVDGQGEIEASIEANLATDGVLADHAGWRLRRTTVPEPRYPAVSVDLGAHPELAAAWCDCAEGSRINVTNPPEQNVPGTVDQLIVGARETYRGRRAWKASMNVSPARVWDVAEVDGDQRVAADGSTLAAAVGVESPDPVNADPYLTDGTLAAWTPSNATVTRSVTTTHDGYSTLLITAAGAVSGGANAAALAPVDGAATYRASLWAWSSTSTTVGPAVDWHNASGGYLSSSFVGPTAIPAATWTLITGTLTPPVGATQAKMRARHDPATPAGRVWYATQIILARVVTFSLASTAANGVWTTDPASFPLDLRVGGERVTASGITGTSSPQTVTISARGVNGVTRAWPAGTEVDVWLPAIVAL